MFRRVLFILSVILCSAVTAHAVAVDSTSVPAITDSLAAALDQALAADTTQKVRDRGYDAAKYMMMKRYLPKDRAKFSAKHFLDNTFISLQERSVKLGTPDYTFGLMTGVSVGKWFHEDHAVKVNASVGRWADNFNGEDIWAGELTATYMFNMTSYLLGYHPERYCNFHVVAGVGTAACGYEGSRGFALTGHAGVNVSVKLASSMEFFIEPLATVYSNAMAVSRAGNWRSWLAAFTGSIGLNANFGHPKVQLIERRWFMSLMVGPNAQNAEMIYDEIGFGKGLGVHVNLGVGHYMTDYLAIRGTFSYSRNKWVVYDEVPYYSNYFAVRVEGMLDLVELISRKGGHFVSASLVGGPELGYMHKDDFGTLAWQVPYIGLSGGVQVKFRVGNRLRVYAEPRGSIIPYNAPSNDKTTLNDYLNYYDGLMNINVGIEFDL